MLSVDTCPLSHRMESISSANETKTLWEKLFENVFLQLTKQPTKTPTKLPTRKKLIPISLFNNKINRL